MPDGFRQARERNLRAGHRLVSSCTTQAIRKHRLTSLPASFRCPSLRTTMIRVSLIDTRHDTPADAVDLQHEFGNLDQNVGRGNLVEVRRKSCPLRHAFSQMPYGNTRVSRSERSEISIFLKTIVIGILEKISESLDVFN